MRIEPDRVLLLVRDSLHDPLYRAHVDRVPDFGNDYGFVEILVRSGQPYAQHLRREARHAQRHLRTRKHIRNFDVISIVSARERFLPIKFSRMSEAEITDSPVLADRS